MEHKTVEKISRKWSNCTIEEQIQLISQYKRFNGQNTEGWLSFLQEQFQIHDHILMMWPSEHSAAKISSL